jgi:hypothetical protein
MTKRKYVGISVLWGNDDRTLTAKVCYQVPAQKDVVEKPLESWQKVCVDPHLMKHPYETHQE